MPYCPVVLPLRILPSTAPLRPTLHIAQGCQERQRTGCLKRLAQPSTRLALGDHKVFFWSFCLPVCYRQFCGYLMTRRFAIIDVNDVLFYLLKNVSCLLFTLLENGNGRRVTGCLRNAQTRDELLCLCLIAQRENELRLQNGISLKTLSRGDCAVADSPVSCLSFACRPDGLYFSSKAKQKRKQQEKTKHADAVQDASVLLTRLLNPA